MVKAEMLEQHHEYNHPFRSLHHQDTRSSQLKWIKVKFCRLKQNQPPDLKSTVTFARQFWQTINSKHCYQETLHLFSLWLNKVFWHLFLKWHFWAIKKVIASSWGRGQAGLCQQLFGQVLMP